MRLERFEDLVGETIRKITRIDGGKGTEEIEFLLVTGEKYRLGHSQQCCEEVTVEDINGELEWLIGTEILQAEVVTFDNETPAGLENYEHSDSYWRWTFYKLATRKGYVTIRWYGAHNGYYSVEVEWSEA